MSQGRRHRMSREQLVALPAVVDVPTAASVLGLSRTTAYELIRIGEWPTPVLRLGKLIRLPTGVESSRVVYDGVGERVVLK